MFKFCYNNYNLYLIMLCRIIKLEKVRERIAQETENKMSTMEISSEPKEDEESDSSSDLDEFIDWRSKS